MNLKAVLKSQYHASLAMLLEAIETCPPDLWNRAGDANAYWQIGYHTLFYTDFYLRRDEAAFAPWERHRPEYHRFPQNAAEALGRTPYSADELIGYARLVDRMIGPAVDDLDLAAETSGFPWYRMSKFEHQLANIRHLQHHAGQLADRLRREGRPGVRWVGGAVAG